MEEMRRPLLGKRHRLVLSAFQCLGFLNIQGNWPFFFFYICNINFCARVKFSEKKKRITIKFAFSGLIAAERTRGTSRPRPKPSVACMHYLDVHVQQKEGVPS